MCAQGVHDRKTEYGMCGIISAFVCLLSERDDFMVSFFLGSLPIWSYLPLVSSLNYLYPSCLSHPLNLRIDQEDKCSRCGISLPK